MHDTPGMSVTPGDVLDFWFGAAAGGGKEALQAASMRWFGGRKTLDEEIRACFLGEIEAALAGELREWERNIRSRLALIVLLDQFTRNVFRHSAHAFAGDARALTLARDAVTAGEDRQLAPVERVFLLMPYQHAEDRGVQEESVRLFAALATDALPEFAEPLRMNLDYARMHRDIVRRFGRFPHRNVVLNRDTTPAEAAWLDESGQRFGQ